MLTENDITELFVNYLHANNYTEIQSKTTSQKGFDITARTREGTMFYVEVKGETSSKPSSRRYGKYFTGKQIWTHGAVALFATLRSMNKPEYRNAQFALAFPESHDVMISQIKDSIDKLGIQVFFVSDTGVRKL